MSVLGSLCNVRGAEEYSWSRGMIDEWVEKNYYADV